eukprot:21579-Heterococcus_DN1.PRE.1
MQQQTAYPRSNLLFKYACALRNCRELLGTVQQGKRDGNTAAAGGSSDKRRSVFWKVWRTLPTVTAINALSNNLGVGAGPPPRIVEYTVARTGHWWQPALTTCASSCCVTAALYALLKENDCCYIAVVAHASPLCTAADSDTPCSLLYCTVDTTWDEDASADAGVEENDADMDDAKLEGFKVRTAVIILRCNSSTAEHQQCVWEHYTVSRTKQCAQRMRHHCCFCPCCSRAAAATTCSNNQ